MVTQSPATTPADPRAETRLLLVRLASLEKGTAEHSRVRNAVVELNMGLVRNAARRFRTREELYDDVVQVGTIGLIKAVNRFEPERGTEFEAFAVPTVAGEIKRFFRDATWAVHVPRRLQERRFALRDAAADLEQEHGRPPTVGELARSTGWPEEVVAEGLRAADGYGALSLDAPRDEADEGGCLADLLGGEDPSLAMAEDLIALKPLMAALTARERRILALRFTYDMTQSQIGAELGLSQMHVSRLLSRTLARLRSRLAVGGA